MREQKEQKMRLIVCGAITLYETECIDIPSVLQAQKRPELSEAFDAIGTALYWLKNELEE